MSNFLEVAPIANMVILVGGGILFVTRVNDILKRVMASTEKVGKAVVGIDKRLTVVETVCALNHQNFKQISTHAHEEVSEEE